MAGSPRAAVDRASGRATPGPERPLTAPPLVSVRGVRHMHENSRHFAMPAYCPARTNFGTGAPVIVAPNGPGISGVAEFLVDRDQEVDRIAPAIARLAAGHGGSLAVVGRRGAGFSALVDVLAEEAAAYGIPAAIARCAPAETDLPYGVVTQLAAQLTGGRLPL